MKSNLIAKLQIWLISHLQPIPGEYIKAKLINKTTYLEKFFKKKLLWIHKSEEEKRSKCDKELSSSYQTLQLTCCCVWML